MADQLTPREIEVVRLVAEGMTTKRIANALGITFKTAATHRYSAQAKLGARNAAELVVKATQLGFVHQPYKTDDNDETATIVRERSHALRQQSAELRRVGEELRAEIFVQVLDARRLVGELCDKLNFLKRPS